MPFFDKYIHSMTTLKQFVQQYKNTPRDKCEKESLEDYESCNSIIICVLDYNIEKQFQRTYTNSKFWEIQEELRWKSCCYPPLLDTEESLQTYSVSKDVRVADGRKDITYTV